MNRYFKIIVLLLLPLFVFGQKFRQEIQNYTDVTSLRNESLTPRKNDKVYIHTTKKLYAYDWGNNTSSDDGLNYIIQNGSYRWKCLNCHLRVELSQDSILLQYDDNNILVQRDTIRFPKVANVAHTNETQNIPYTGVEIPTTIGVNVGDTNTAQFSDGTVVDYTYDGTAWVLDFVEENKAINNLQVVNEIVERGNLSLGGGQPADFIRNTYNWLGGSFQDKWQSSGDANLFDIKANQTVNAANTTNSGAGAINIGTLGANGQYKLNLHGALWMDNGRNCQFIGNQSGQNSTSNNSVAIGRDAFRNNNNNEQVFIGSLAGANNTVSSGSNSIGYSSMRLSTSKFSNAFGWKAAESSSGNNNNFFGYESGANNSGSQVSAIGLYSARSNTGNAVIAIGNATAQNNTNSLVISIGNSAAQNNSGTIVNAIGIECAKNNTGNDVYILGHQAALNNTGSFVFGMGRSAVANNTGSEVVAIGGFATGGTNSGDNVNLIGTKAGSENDGSYVIGIGQQSVEFNTGDHVVSLGYSSARNNTGDNVIAIGRDAGLVNTQSNRIILGFKELPQFANAAAAAAAMPAASVDGIYIYWDQSDNTIKVRP